jgi:hypothetical protein
MHMLCCLGWWEAVHGRQWSHANTLHAQNNNNTVCKLAACMHCQFIFSLEWAPWDCMWLRHCFTSQGSRGTHDYGQGEPHDDTLDQHTDRTLPSSTCTSHWTMQGIEHPLDNASEGQT